ncbi:MAG: SoxR reducing system RseC family protein [Prevotella sp.]|jgi:sigma-E factor negative regulatory protein RseC|nr:SoxR reducing system RseC family protein [Prevotella sp.]
MVDNISHSGVVESVEDGCVHVRIVVTSACAACKVAGYCNAAESKEKVVDVYTAKSAAYVVGQAVTVSASRQVATHALLLAFGLPFVILVAVLVGVLLLTGDELWAALGGLLALVPYYGILWLFRQKVRDRLAFQIE